MDELKEITGAHDVQTSTLNELWYETVEKIKKLAVTTVGYAQKQEKKEWFDEECTTVNEEKNCARDPNSKQNQELQSSLR
jgi:hypothetical protein